MSLNLSLNPNEQYLYDIIENGSLKASTDQVSIRVDESERQHYLGVSSLGHNACELWFYYHRRELCPVEEIPARSRRIFRLGKILEEETIEFIRLGGGIVTEQQIEIHDFDYRLRGHLDGVFNQDWVLELKTANKDNFDKFCDFSVPVMNSFYGYYCQVQMYCFYTKRKAGMLVFHGKNTSEIVPREILYDKATVRFLLQKAQYILDSPSPLAIPDAIRGTSRCKWCEFQESCQKIHNKEI
jgi:hypothetical protein